MPDVHVLLLAETLPDAERLASAWNAAAPHAGTEARVVRVPRADAGPATPPGHVPATNVWWVDGDTYLGRVQIRHRLTPYLRDVDGHIGYHVVAAHRRRGHATAMLAAALPVAAALGLGTEQQRF